MMASLGRERRLREPSHEDPEIEGLKALEDNEYEQWPEIIVKYKITWNLVKVSFYGSHKEWLKLVTALKDYATREQVDISFFGVEEAEEPPTPTEREKLLAELHGRSMKEIVHSIRTHDIAHVELAEEYSADEVCKIDRAVTEHHNSIDRQTLSYWRYAVRKDAVSIAPERRQELLEDLRQFKLSKIINYVLLYQITKGELASALDSETVTNVKDWLQKGKFDYRLDIAFFYKEVQPANDSSSDKQAQSPTFTSDSSQGTVQPLVEPNNNNNERAQPPTNAITNGNEEPLTDTNAGNNDALLRKTLIDSLPKTPEEAAEAIIRNNISRTELTTTFTADELRQIDFALTTSLNAAEKSAITYWKDSIRDDSEATLSAEERDAVIENMWDFSTTVIINLILLHRASYGEMFAVFADKELKSVTDELLKLGREQSIDVSFLQIPEGCVPPANPANTVTPPLPLTTNTLTRSRSKVLKDLKAITDVPSALTYIVQHKIAFYELSAALETSFVSDLVKHIVENPEGLDLSSLWKKPTNVSRPRQLFTHFIKDQNEPDGYYFLRPTLRFWLLNSLPFAFPACPPLPPLPQPSQAEPWDAGVTLHGDPDVEAGMTIKAMPRKTPNGKGSFQFDHKGKRLSWQGNYPIVRCNAPEAQLRQIASQKLQEAEQRNVTALATWRTQVTAWVPLRERWELAMFHLAQVHVRQVHWTEDADPDEVLDATNDTASGATHRDVIDRIYNNGLQEFERRKKKRRRASAADD
ncbi:uncharacterized protein BHQ10_005104 [Talaromyces amestolkiae]|uniref:Uncharacterized protein n=1 Tax=Talaromyces amestolkiae TaxID=1196081 RepID=A0A364KZW4_TALAM|nr:uncharacterized protein BHQ10_005104 [Talaromyces amestolkiae]RAO69092.1 hypothetical protein BHQ10_005104 [Talaromyces amestolkiae]